LRTHVQYAKEGFRKSKRSKIPSLTNLSPEKKSYSHIIQKSCDQDLRQESIGSRHRSAARRHCWGMDSINLRGLDPHESSDFSRNSRNWRVRSSQWVQPPWLIIVVVIIYMYRTYVA
jgi:hypothetical protein